MHLDRLAEERRKKNRMAQKEINANWSYFYLRFVHC